jgi:uncharacterized protein YdeI (YjbR/CyaY-like superfamily)
MKATFFPTKTDFRKWLDKNHTTEKELIVGFYKVGTKKPSITWSESVDEALCYGWIDSVRRSINDESYCIRFTPRKPNSIWSAINIAKVETLSKQGLIKPAGIKSFELRKDHKSKIYSHEQELKSLPSEFEKQFKANKKAWLFFTSQAPSYQKTAIHIVTTAKQETTKLKRLLELINASEAGEKMASLKWGKK